MEGHQQRGGRRRTEEGYPQGGGGGRMRKKVQGIRSINGRYKIDERVLRIV